ncbi:MAG: hypothetical protein IPI58_05920 [Alphaproteobacteria bacterium]|nr:MAG: hypothetical protein IPI58_05920 [Alphaproteobacteria bacterium]
MTGGVLEAALGDLFADPHLATTIAWHPIGGGAALNLRAVLRNPDLVTGFGEGRVATTSMVVEIRATDIAAPRPGDRLEIDGAIYVVQSEPLADAARLIWTLNTRPE